MKKAMSLNRRSALLGVVLCLGLGAAHAADPTTSQKAGQTVPPTAPTEGPPRVIDHYPTTPPATPVQDQKPGDPAAGRTVKDNRVAEPPHRNDREKKLPTHDTQHHSPTNGAHDHEGH